jgi:hypothetical protein
MGQCYYESVIQQNCSDSQGFGKLSQVSSELPDVEDGLGFFALDIGYQQPTALSEK